MLEVIHRLKPSMLKDIRVVHECVTCDLRPSQTPDPSVDCAEDNSKDAVNERAALGLNYSHFGIRLTGQDSERGTFNQRHAVTYDTRTRRNNVHIDRVHPEQDFIEVRLRLCEIRGRCNANVAGYTLSRTLSRCAPRACASP